MLLLVTLGVLNASNYVFHVVVSRLLGPAEYGALAALLAVVMVLSVPFGVLQTVVAKKTAALRASGREGEVAGLAVSTLKTLVPVAWLAGLLVLAVGTPALTLFLHLDAASAALVAPYVFISLLASVPLGVLQGEHRFAAISALLLAGVALRLALGIGLVWAGVGMTGAVLATALAPLAIAPGVLLIGLTSESWRTARRTLGHLRGEFGLTLAALTSFWLLAEIDIALARHFLDPEEAGLYSSAGLLARALLFLPGAIVIVAFPRFVAARERREGEVHWLRVSLGATAALLAVALPALILLREPLVSMAFGERFLSSAELIPLLAVAMTFLAFVGVLAYYHVAMGTRAHYLVLAGVVLEVVLIGFFHDRPEHIALIVALVGALVALTTYAAAVSASRWRPPLEHLLGDGRAVPALLAGEPSVELSLVLPCHNAGAGLRNVLNQLLHELEEIGSYEVIVVSDGSTDDTVRIAEDFASEAVRVFHYPERGGKGHALQVGLTEARGGYVAFFDADGDIRPEAIHSFLALMKLYEPDVVLGSKRHPLSEVYYPPLRRVLSWTYHKLARLLFRVNVRDTQTGLKMFRREVLRAVLPRLLEKRYAFDLEFLVVARSLGYKRVFEAPVQIEYKFASQVNPGAAFRIGLDTLAIFYRHYILNTYRLAGQEPQAEPFAPGAPLPALVEGLPPLSGPERRNGRRKESLRILFLNWRDIKNPDAGGAEVFTHEVARRWVEQGHEVTVLTSRFRGAPPNEAIDGVQVRRIGRLRDGSFHVLVQRELWRLRGYDAVIDAVNTIPFFTPVWQQRLPATLALVFQRADEVWNFELPKPVAALGRWVEPRLLRPYRQFPVVTISESGKRDLEQLGFENVQVVHPGRDEPPNLSGIAKERVPTFLFAGRLAANKRPDHAVAAFELIRNVCPEAQLWIVGRGPMEAKLSGGLPEGAQLLGYLDRGELYERMARAHCLLVPSVREGWGLVVIEANSVGTPAVGYDVYGIRDSIQDGRTGLLATRGDSTDLARQALSLIEDPSAYAAMRLEAARWAVQFSWDATARDLLQFIVRTMTASGRAQLAPSVAVAPAPYSAQSSPPGLSS